MHKGNKTKERLIFMPPMDKLYYWENTKEKGRLMGPLFLQGRALELPMIELFLKVINKKEMVKKSKAHSLKR
jgi:hypothetical protein